MFIINFIDILVQILAFAIIARAVLTWFPIKPNNVLVVFLFQVTEPILAPLRRVVPRLGMLDLTPLIAIVLLQITAGLIRRLFT
ncbi:MAG: YggT family protein, partial [Dehalococcoidia bacterium]